jgi:hypothetical protein
MKPMKLLHREQKKWRPWYIRNISSIVVDDKNSNIDITPVIFWDIDAYCEIFGLFK